MGFGFGMGVFCLCMSFATVVCGRVRVFSFGFTTVVEMRGMTGTMSSLT